MVFDRRKIYVLKGESGRSQKWLAAGDYRRRKRANFRLHSKTIHFYDRLFLELSILRTVNS